MIEEFDNNGLMEKEKEKEEISSNTDISNHLNKLNNSNLSQIEPINLPTEEVLVLDPPSNLPKKKESFSIVEIILILMLVALVIVAVSYLVIYYITEPIQTLFDNDSFSKPIIDKKTYKAIKLHNGIEVILISDRNSSASAMSIALNVGSLHDPLHMPGIATLAKRIMILKSTKETTNLTDFNNHLAKNSGRFELKVNDSMTSLYFTIGKEGFYHASLLFADFFKYPEVNEDDLRREMDIIQSEYRSHLNDFASMANIIEHKVVYGLDDYFPYGSNETLRQKNLTQIKAEVESYIKNNFIADNIKVVILGTNSIDELKGIAIKLFGDIPSKESLSKTNETLTPYISQIANKTQDNLRLGQLIFINNDYINELKIVIYFKRHPSLQSEFYLKYLEYLLRDRKFKSLATVLKMNNSINSFSVSNDPISDHLIKFTINFNLYYVESWNNELQIVKYAFNYLRLVRETTNHSITYNEMRLIFKKNFSFKSNPSDHLLEYTRDLNENMFAYQGNLNLLLFQKDYVPEYNEEIIKFYIDQLRAENCVIFNGAFIHPKPLDLFKDLLENPDILSNLKVEKYFKKVKFGFDSIKKEKIKELNEIEEFNKELDLRPPNQYITTLNDIKDIKEDHLQVIVPSHLFESNHLNFWHNVSTIPLFLIIFNRKIYHFKFRRFTPIIK